MVSYIYRKAGEKLTDFDYIYRKYFKDVYRFLLSLGARTDVAEEITQETFFKAMKNLDRFEEGGNIRVWLCQIAKNTYFTLYTKEKRGMELQEQVGQKNQEAQNHQQSIEESFMSKESVFELHKQIHLLEEPYREVFYLRFFCELSFLKIGELFGKSESWARVTFHRVKLKLKEAIK